MLKYSERRGTVFFAKQNLKYDSLLILGLIRYFILRFFSIGYLWKCSVEAEIYSLRDFDTLDDNFNIKRVHRFSRRLLVQEAVLRNCKGSAK
jgi:hypothetical protein